MSITNENGFEGWSTTGDVVPNNRRVMNPAMHEPQIDAVFSVSAGGRVYVING